jgi:hypothetical protein
LDGPGAGESKKGLEPSLQAKQRAELRACEEIVHLLGYRVAFLA